MANEPDSHPVDEEIEQILADNSDLVDELNEFDRAYERGEADLVSDKEARRSLKALDPNCSGQRVLLRHRHEQAPALVGPHFDELAFLD